MNRPMLSMSKEPIGRGSGETDRPLMQAVVTRVTADHKRCGQPQTLRRWWRWWVLFLSRWGLFDVGGGFPGGFGAGVGGGVDLDGVPDGGF